MTNSVYYVADSTTMRVPDRDELVGRAAALWDGLWEDAAECDRERRLTERGITGITAAGLMRLMTPRRLGGYETDMRTLLDVTTELGRGCCSAAWVTGVLNGGNFVASLFPQEAQDEVWGDAPDARTALVLGPPSSSVVQVDGGVLVSGEWAYVSGSLHSEWVSAVIVIGANAGEPVAHFALMRTDEVEIRDTWFVVGMRGTGSNTIVARHVFVPRHRLIPYLPVINGETDKLVDASHLYRNCLMGLFSIGLIGALIGGVEAAFRYVQGKGQARPVIGSTYAIQAQSPTFQLDLAAASMTIDTAKLHAQRIADTIDEFAMAGQNLDLVTRARERMEATRVAELCREAMDILLTAHGSSAFSESNPLQRIWRDINSGSRHAKFGMGIPRQLYGRALVGMDPREISMLI